MHSKIVRLNTPPIPTISDPYAQIKWIFFQLEREHSEPTASNFKYAKNKYIDYLDEVNAYYDSLEHNKRFYLSVYWEADALIRFNRWLEAQDLKSKTRYSLYKTVRQTMDLAYALRVIDTIVYHAPMFKGVSETNSRSSYKDEEQEVINAAVARWMNLSVRVLGGYKATGQGIPYRRNGQHPSITIDGEPYEIHEAASVFSVEYSVITNRLEQGWTPRQAVGLEPSPRAIFLNWKIHGDVYKTVAAISNKFGISNYIISSRIKKGWTPEQVVGLAPAPGKDYSKFTGKAKKVIVDGHEFSSIKKLSEFYKINYKTLKQRLHSGWSLREAVGLDKRCSPGFKLTIEGVDYKSINEAASVYRVSSGNLALCLRKGYTPEQAVGLIPRIVSKDDERALLWSFENEYDCDAYEMLEDFRRRKLTAVATEKKLRQLFSRWGVWPYVDDRLVMPLVVELGMLTGLNVEALKLLEIDSFQVSHRLTQQPVISYRKKRSGSSSRSEDRELHIQLLDFEDLYIDESIAAKVNRIFRLITDITAKIRTYAPSNISKLLFIFEDVELSRKMGERVVVSLDPKRKAGHWYRRFCNEEGLYDRFGNNFSFNISRCRPTLATNMVLAGAELFQVQAALGHESIEATAAYLDEQRLKPEFNRELSKKIESIAVRSLNMPKQAEGSQKGCVAKCDGGSKLGYSETLSGCGCLNPYSPSENVRKLTKHKEGAVCKFWNMCLLCDSSIVTETSLPKLIVYRNRVAAALEEDFIAIRSRKQLLIDVVELIDGILKNDVIFPFSVISEARAIAASLDDLLIEQLIYQGI